MTFLSVPKMPARVLVFEKTLKICNELRNDVFEATTRRLLRKPEWIDSRAER